jgi:hypothetical protein
MAKVNDAAQAQKLADRLSKENPLGTMIQDCFLPTIRAEIELSHGNAGKAIEFLERAKPYELGVLLYPAHVRVLAKRAG